MDLMNDFITKNAEQAVKKQEQLVLSVLPKGITSIEISKRCKWVSHVETPHIRTLHFDGKPVLTLHDPEVETVHKDDGSVSLKTTQKYARH
jgi:hypothetical protein